MAHVTLSNQALRDVADILAYYERHAGERVAMAFRQDLAERSEMIASYPDAGRPVTRAGTRVLMLARHPHQVFYKRFPRDELRILRVRHAKRRPLTA